MNIGFAAFAITVCVALGCIVSAVNECAATLRRIEDYLYERGKR